MEGSYTVKDVMTRTIIAAHPEMPMREAAILLVENQISGLPVLDSTGGLVGVLSEKDVLKHLIDVKEEKQHGILVKEYMSEMVWTLSPATALMAAAQILKDTNYGRLPVVDGGKLIGIISIHDCIQSMT